MACPFLELSFKKCRKNLTIKSLDKALELCGNDYTECRVYQELFRKKMIRRQVFRRKIA
jgi:hypothetical protein